MGRGKRDIHLEPFDEGTLTKLDLFRVYLQEWIPVFVARQEIIWPNINIIDFFAGPGTDKLGKPGSPLIILEELASYSELIKSKNLNVQLFFNEFNSEKYEQLRNRIEDNKASLVNYKVEIACQDFKDSFEQKLPLLRNKKSANLLFIDQTGFKQVDEEVFRQLLRLERTDFLFFISSSTIKRFPDHPYVQQYMKMDVAEIEETPFHEIHRLVLERYRSLIPPGADYYLSSFSLKKNSGLYGLIFGSGHPLGMEKFLKACWKIDQLRGEANFDIDEDKIDPDAPELFPRKPKKVELFEYELRDKILRGEIIDDLGIYKFTLLNGFIPSQAKAVFERLIEEGKVKSTKLNLSHKVCAHNAFITKIEVMK